MRLVVLISPSQETLGHAEDRDDYDVTVSDTIHEIEDTTLMCQLSPSMTYTSLPHVQVATLGSPCPYCCTPPLTHHVCT